MRWVFLPLVAAAFTGAGFGFAVPAAAQVGSCGGGRALGYVFGFADLKAYIGDAMGDAVTCEFPDPNGTGDVHQRTTTGLAFWRKSTNTPTFTNGFDHWGHTPNGWVAWTGTSIDPPTTSAAAPRNSVRPTPGSPVCISAEIDGPALLCWFVDGYFQAVRRTQSADVVLASKMPGGHWVISRPGSGASCGRVDDPPPDQLFIECLALNFEFRIQQPIP